MPQLDQLKRKIKSGKEMAKNIKAGPSFSEPDTEGAPSEPKRPQTTNVGGADRSLSEENEGTQDDSESTQADPPGYLGENDICACSFCDFVAKNPTALKVHSKRKHSQRALSSHAENVSQKNCGESALSDVKEMENILYTDREDAYQPEHLAVPTQPEMTLLMSPKNVPLKQSERTSSYQTENSPDQSPGNEAETTQNHCDQSAGDISSPTRILLEMIDPSLGDNRKYGTCEMKTVDEGTENGQVGLTCSSDVAGKRTSKRCPKPKVLHACSYCGHEFRDRPSLEMHVKRRHTKVMNYFCKFCSYSCVAKCDYEKHCMSNKHRRKILEKRETSFEVDKVDSTGGTSEHQCSSCSFTASSSILLVEHMKLQHGAENRLHCQMCHFYTCTAEAMQAHLEAPLHLQAAQEKNTSPLYQHCVEKVLVILSNEQREEEQREEMSEQGGKREVEPQSVSKYVPEFQETANFSTEENFEGSITHRRKRGRPKSSHVTTCSHCGLIASNPTNLSVHIRRRHSRLYSFFCKLCNYYCVTKGDMDRHCETKKHIKRAQADGAAEAVVCLDTEQAVQVSEDEVVWAAQMKGATGDEKDSDEMEQTLSEAPCKKNKYDLVNSCSHCDFVAHSMASLRLHVRRKHKRDFEFVCLACSYYAVTHREMSRHMATEKHKQKRDTYLQQRDRKDSAEVNQHLASANQTTFTEDAHQNMKKPSAKETGDSAEALERTDGVENDMTLERVTKTKEPNQSSAENMCGLVQSNSPGEHVMEYTEEDDEDEDEESLEVKADGENLRLRATPFDKCIFHLKAQTEALQEVTEGDSKPTTRASSLQGVKNQRLAESAGTKGAAPNPRIRCEDCGFLADGLSGLNVHISMKHPSKEKHFHCLLCGKSFYTDSNLQQHLSSAAHLRNEQGSVEELPEGGASFKCVRCSELCGTEQELFLHIKEKHEELLREVNKYILEDTEQINRERQENQGSVCKYCGKVCKSSNSMAFLAHVRTHTGSKPFMCKICNFATAQLGDARNHVKRHLGMREYKCHVCGWAFVMKKHLNTHLLGKHGLGQPKERKYECELCERSFSEKWALNNHMKLHTGDKPYKCSWESCHYAFLTLSAMKDHYRTHTGEKSFLCDLCGFAGGTRHALTKHRRQHTGERPFRCQLCSFASTTQSHLTRHKRVHTGEKPYRCPWCDYRSNCAENIRKHILHTGKHEGVMMYNCPKCDYGTNAPMDFRNHLKENHPDIENPDLAYLHAGIVSKSFECRLKGQGASYVETESAFAPDEGRLGSEALQQVIIIQGYGEAGAMEQELEESAAATLHTLAMTHTHTQLQVAQVLHITEDGQVIPCHKVAPSGTPLPEGATQYLLVEGQEEGQSSPEQAGVSQVLSESSTALDALLCAVSEIGQQGSAGETEIITSEQEGHAQGEGHEEVQVYGEVVEGVEGEGAESVDVVTQVVGHGNQDTPEGVVQEVLQFAASQLMMKEGLTQVIVNDEGTHYIVTELDDSTLQVEGTVYAQSEGAESGETSQPHEGTVTYSHISLNQAAQE
ncbi:zinc finger protein 407 [Pygocentrus nattereri]|uniref:C2H2-type domain-containing protein n=1 Tax=Pygocentrus nattereri TaxID=42514 RepID=A0AAR2IN02_PYGNA|nr:zinc finger protein 407 [Pygocentrus nattereri]XP_037386900.1 zinc finger protein 407 [Pygocentrus nattereri]